MKKDLSSKDLSHHGIVATVCDEIGLVEKIDSIIPPDPRAELSIGECVKLMIINGLGFCSRPLYLQAQFFDSKPIQRFLGRELPSEKISDDRLGRCLDKCYEEGCDKIFAEVSSKAALNYGVSRKFRHLDSTSISVCGEYETESEDDFKLVTFGHSKDHRPDLKQFMISLISSQDGDVPLLAQTIPGNTSDQTHFKDVLMQLKLQINEGESTYFVADSALYTSKTLPEISDKLKWISRVPEKIKEVKAFEQETDVTDMIEVGDGYSTLEKKSDYAGVNQRWLLVFSEQAKKREVKTLEKRIAKELVKAKKDIKKITSIQFSCKSDATVAVEAFVKKLKYHRLKNVIVHEKKVKKGQGRPRKDEKTSYVYSLQVEFEKDEDAISSEMNTKGKFVIATNELDSDCLSNGELLFNYKNGQQSVERGFKFLKDPSFMCASTYLKRQERIVALGMIMCLCLLVYMLAQILLRTQLTKLKETVPDQKGKESERPSMRWIFQVFEGVHLLLQKVNGRTKELVLNLNPVREKILSIISPRFEKMYESTG